MRIARADRCRTGTRHAAITLASHTSLRKVWLVVLAPQACQVEFELVEGVQQQNTSWTRHQVVCIVFKEIVQLNVAEKLRS